MNQLLRTSVNGLTFVAGDDMPFCHVCAMAKSHAQPRSRDASERPDGPLQKLGADNWGPVHVLSIGKYRFVFGVTDYYSGYTWVVFMHTKDETPQALRLVVRAIRRVCPDFGLPARAGVRLRLDNDSVFTSEAFRAVCDEFLIVPEFSAPYCQWQNGLQERMWLTLAKMEVSMVIYEGLGLGCCCGRLRPQQGVQPRGWWHSVPALVWSTP